MEPGQEPLLVSETLPIAQRAAPDAPAGDPPLAEVKDVGGTWLQLGAFGNRDNAEALKSRMERELGSLGDKLVVQASGNLFRLQLGPWASAEEAHRMATRLAETLEMKPVVVQR